jgi:sensor domain CHASE-containing protein
MALYFLYFAFIVIIITIILLIRFIIKELYKIYLENKIKKQQRIQNNVAIEVESMTEIASSINGE